MENQAAMQQENIKEKGKEKDRQARFESKGMDSTEGGMGVAGLTNN